MKPLLILTRIFMVGIFWSILFLEGIRVIMLTNWRFDIVRPSHWNYAWNLWLSGWVIDEIKEWAFILIILTFIPVWLSGWAALSMIKWGKIIEKIMLLPFTVTKKIFAKQIKKISDTASVKVVKKKKSYKEIRPKSIRPPMDESSYALSTDKRAALSGTAPKSSIKPTPMKTPPAEFNHSLFQMDDDNTDIDFDLFEEKVPEVKTEKPVEKTKPAAAPAPKTENSQRNNKKESASKQHNETKPAPRSNSNSTLEILKQKGYDVITGVTIKNTLIDFIGVSKSHICVCLNDKEPGDWLADEERFNDEEPLWFSESSHRVSPVRKVDLVRNILKQKLSDADLKFEITAYVIEQIGNIINAEDMFEIWKDMDIHVTRIDRGTPKEIRLFAKDLEDADGKIEKDTFEKIKKLIRGIA